MQGPLPFASSVCHGCRFMREVRTARSVFLMCTALPQKYPPQPVRSCQAREPVTPGRPLDKA